jgi:heme-degrading monooxygenase HmoA
MEVHIMIGRMWCGRATTENADAYEELLRTKVLPGIKNVDGYQGAYVLRRPIKNGVEFVTLTLFDSLDSVRAFAGSDYKQAVVIPEAEALLSAFDKTATHYEIAIQPASMI